MKGYSNFPLVKVFFFEDNFYWDFAEGTTAKAQGTTAIAVVMFLVIVSVQEIVGLSLSRDTCVFKQET